MPLFSSTLQRGDATRSPVLTSLVLVGTGWCNQRCIWGYVMRTNIELDGDLVQEGLKLSRARTKRELVQLALKEFVENRRRLSLLELEGKIEFAEGYNHKRMREGV